MSNRNGIQIGITMANPFQLFPGLLSDKHAVTDVARKAGQPASGDVAFTPFKTFVAQVAAAAAAAEQGATTADRQPVFAGSVSPLEKSLRPLEGDAGPQVAAVQPGPRQSSDSARPQHSDAWNPTAPIAPPSQAEAEATRQLQDTDSAKAFASIAVAVGRPSEHIIDETAAPSATDADAMTNRAPEQPPGQSEILVDARLSPDAVGPSARQGWLATQNEPASQNASDVSLERTPFDATLMASGQNRTPPAVPLSDRQNTRSASGDETMRAAVPNAATSTRQAVVSNRLEPGTPPSQVVPPSREDFAASRDEVAATPQLQGAELGGSFASISVEPARPSEDLMTPPAALSATDARATANPAPELPSGQAESLVDATRSPAVVISPDQLGRVAAPRAGMASQNQPDVSVEPTRLDATPTAFGQDRPRQAVPFTDRQMARPASGTGARQAGVQPAAASNRPEVISNSANDLTAGSGVDRFAQRQVASTETTASASVTPRDQPLASVRTTEPLPPETESLSPVVDGSRQRTAEAMPPRAGNPDLGFEVDTIEGSKVVPPYVAQVKGKAELPDGWRRRHLAGGEAARSVGPTPSPQPSDRGTDVETASALTQASTGNRPAGEPEPAVADDSGWQRSAPVATVDSPQPDATPETVGLEIENATRADGNDELAPQQRLAADGLAEGDVVAEPSLRESRRERAAAIVEQREFPSTPMDWLAAGVEADNAGGEERRQEFQQPQQSPEGMNRIDPSPAPINAWLESQQLAATGDDAIEPLSLDALLTEGPSEEVVRNIGTAVKEAVDSSVRQEGAEVQLRLHPAELGELRVRVVQLDGGVETQIVASEQVTGELLQQHREQLLAALTNLGFETSDVDISYTSHSDQSSRDSAGGRPGRDEEGRSFNPKAPASAARPSESSGGLNIVA
jgi:flagellar hook-length control protein FliK